MNKSDLITHLGAVALIVAIASFVCGCYIGKATFEGENIRIYPFFHADESGNSGEK